MTCTSNGGMNCTPGKSTGGAQTPTDCGTFGNSVTYDAFTGNAYNANYFWGYLLSLHEAINQWTGLATGGWPTDWWADHVSAFPNLMDFHIMNVIGTANMDNNLLTVATAQKMRFYPGGDSADPRVVALDDVYGMMPNMDGLAGFSQVFSLVGADKMSWETSARIPTRSSPSTSSRTWLSPSDRRAATSSRRCKGSAQTRAAASATACGTRTTTPRTCARRPMSTPSRPRTARSPPTASRPPTSAPFRRAITRA